MRPKATCLAAGTKPIPKIAASLMCANLLNLQKDIEELDRAGG